MIIYEEILALLSGSPELYKFLLTRQEKIPVSDYADIIAGAPVSLDEKEQLLTLLFNSVKNKEDATLIQRYSDFLHNAINALKNKGRQQISFSVELLEKGKVLDGPYVVFSMKDAQKAIRNYIAMESADNLDCCYWKISLYRQGDTVECETFVPPAYTYIATSRGEIQYFLRSAGKCAHGDACIESSFGSVHLNLPVPYQPGNILQIDCSPYVPGPYYCMVTEVSDDCCGIQCLYACSNGKIKQGALKHGNYFPDCYSTLQYLSPLYRIRVYTGTSSLS